VSPSTLGWVETAEGAQEACFTVAKGAVDTMYRQFELTTPSTEALTV